MFIVSPTVTIREQLVSATYTLIINLLWGHLAKDKSLVNNIGRSNNHSISADF